MHTVIAIDGPAASGKSTVARQIAEHLGYTYVNTGAMYRAVTWWLLEKGVDTSDAAAVEKAVRQARVECRIEKGETIFRLDGVDPMPHVRDARVNDKVSQVASVPYVREVLVSKQQSLAGHADLVMEGRDIGTVVFPKAHSKFFIDADPVVRAKRRQGQGEADVIAKRDKIDSSRKTSPLTRAADAYLIDSSTLSIEEVVSRALEHLSKSS
jgi:cytidylate kinase